MWRNENHRQIICIKGLAKYSPQKNVRHKKSGPAGRLVELELSRSYLIEFSFFSILAKGIAPGKRSPSAKKMVGVPEIFKD